MVYDESGAMLPSSIPVLDFDPKNGRISLRADEVIAPSCQGTNCGVDWILETMRIPTTFRPRPSQQAHGRTHCHWLGHSKVQSVFQGLFTSNLNSPPTGHHLFHDGEASMCLKATAWHDTRALHRHLALLVGDAVLWATPSSCPTTGSALRFPRWRCASCVAPSGRLAADNTRLYLCRLSAQGRPRRYAGTVAAQKQT